MVIKEATELAKVPENLAHPHALRHAAGYSLINNDVDVRLVQEFLGHKTPAMTMQYPFRLLDLEVALNSKAARRYLTRNPLGNAG